jgi:hypothetical protein
VSPSDCAAGGCDHDPRMRRVVMPRVPSTRYSVTVNDRAVAFMMQVVTSLGSVEYLYKYVEKGPDGAVVNVASKSMPAPEPEPDTPRDEIREYEDARVYWDVQRGIVEANTARIIDSDFSDEDIDC